MRHGSRLDPPNRFESIHRETDYEHLEWEEEYLHQLEERRIEYLVDASKSIVSENDSPDIPFRYSLNPYRGCVHACAYCYARNTHEYLGFNAGRDFETKIFVKPRAPELFQSFLAKPGWRAESIMFSGVTDCYQPAERAFQLTRQCLELAWEHRQPIGIVTKNALVTRDLDLLGPMSQAGLAHVFVTLTSLDPELARVMEPRTSIPAARLRAVQRLAEAGVAIGVMVAPIIPGLNDSEIPEILQASAEAGAKTAHSILLRLPQTVEPVFREWLQRTQPDQHDKILGRIRQTRSGHLNSSTWGERMQGTGELAEQIGNLFRVFTKKLGLDADLPPLDSTQFRLPHPPSRQLKLF